MGRRSKAKKDLQVYDARAKVTKRTYQQVQKLARRRGLSASDIVRLAVAEKLEREEAQA